MNRHFFPVPRNEHKAVKPVVKAPVTEKVPVVTLNEHLHRIEEWAQKPSHTPASVIYNDQAQFSTGSDSIDNLDLEEQSELIDEGLRLLDSREQQISNAPTSPASTDEELIFEEELHGPMPYIDENQKDHDEALGKHFRESKKTAREYVKTFEEAMTKKKVYDSLIFNTYPYLKAKKALELRSQHNLGTIKESKEKVTHEQEPSMAPPMDIDLQNRGSRTVRFQMKTATPNHPPPQKAQAKHGILDAAETKDAKWASKQNNDRDWWRWKIKQRFMENDDLLHKLAAQRMSMENRFKKNGSVSNKNDKRPTVSIVPSLIKAGQSRHVTLEPATAKSTRDPIQTNFYSPSKRILTTLTAAAKPEIPIMASMIPSSTAKNKLKVLKKDPYLAKLLSGNEIFKPEIMLYANQPKSVANQGNSGMVPSKRKMSLDSLSDSTDDDDFLDKPMNHDVTILYERPSDLKINIKSKAPLAILSREPSDGFVNLPILLETGRFNRYSKLKSIKTVKNPFLRMTGATTQASERQRRARSKSVSERSKTSKNQNKTKQSNYQQRQAGESVTPPPPPPSINSQKVPKTGPKSPTSNTDNLSTKDWARRLVDRMKQSSHTATNRKDYGLNLTEVDQDIGQNYRYNRTNYQYKKAENQNKKSVKIDQEVNVLFNEILMSKMTLGRDEELVPVTQEPTNAIRKDVIKPIRSGHSIQGRIGVRPKGFGFGETEKMMKIEETTKPKGLDVWLDNIRERAKKYKLAPLSTQPKKWNAVDSEELLNRAKPFEIEPLLMTTFENAAFKLSFD